MYCLGYVAAIEFSKIKSSYIGEAVYMAMWPECLLGPD